MPETLAEESVEAVVERRLDRAMCAIKQDLVEELSERIKADLAEEVAARFTDEWVAVRDEMVESVLDAIPRPSMDHDVVLIKETALDRTRADVDGDTQETQEQPIVIEL